MLEKIRERFRKEKNLSIKVKIPKHVAFTLDGMEEWQRKNQKPVYEKSFSKISELIKHQVKLDIPIVTFYVLGENPAKNEFLENLSDFINSLIDNEFIKEQRIKISVLGKWYNLPNKIVEPIKKLLDLTKEHEQFFVNLCINYDGQEEIVDACKLIARKVNAGKIDPEAIDKKTIKENLYSSYFIPPELIIVNGIRNSKTSLLLFDSVSSSVYFSHTLWPDFEKSDLMDGINVYQKSR